MGILNKYYDLVHGKEKEAIAILELIHKIGFENATGKQLYDFYTLIEDKGGLFDWIELIEYAVMYDVEKVYSILEDVQRKKKRIAAHYPAFENSDPSLALEKEVLDNAEFVGDIMDGGLYLISL